MSGVFAVCPRLPPKEARRSWTPHFLARLSPKKCTKPEPTDERGWPLLIRPPCSPHTPSLLVFIPDLPDGTSSTQAAIFRIPPFFPHHFRPPCPTLRPAILSWGR